MSNNTQVNTGTAAVKLSIRSKIPPCPGIKLPLSLMPDERLNILSVKSPKIEAKVAITALQIKLVGATTSGAKRAKKSRQLPLR